MKSENFDLRKADGTVITVYGLNVNKFQAPNSKVIFERMWMDQPDIICLQETTSAVEEFPDYANPKRAGYYFVDGFDPNAPTAGVAIFSKVSGSLHRRDFCAHNECRGRFVDVLLGDLRVASVYAYADPTHSKKKSKSQEERVRSKENRGRRILSRLQFYSCLGLYMRRNADARCIIVTDLNVALTYSDVANSRQWSTPWANQGDGRYREAVVSAMQGDAAWADSFRVIHGCHERRATVWFNTDSFAGKGGVEQGFGIDCQLVSNALRPTIVRADVEKPSSWQGRFSDHALTIGEYRMEKREAGSLLP